MDVAEILHCCGSGIGWQTWYLTSDTVGPEHEGEAEVEQNTLCA